MSLTAKAGLVLALTLAASVFFLGFTQDANAAVGIKQGTFNSGTATGNVNVTGVGFQPKAVIFYWTRQTAAGFSAAQLGGMGFATASPTIQNRGVAIASDDNAATTNTGRRRSATYSIIFLSNGTPTLSGQGSVTTFGADGFTVNWNTAPGVNAIIHYIALGGTDITNAVAGNFTLTTGAGTQSVAGLGFQPDSVLFLSTLNEAVDTNTAGSEMNVGFADGTNQGGSAICGRDARTTTTHAGSLQRTDNALVSLNPGACTAIDNLVAVQSFDADGFTLNKTTATTAVVWNYIAIKGGRHKVGAFTQPTAGTPPISQATTGIGFQPVGLFLSSFNKAANTAAQVDGKLSLGGAQSSTARGAIWLENSNIINSDANMNTSATKIITMATTATVNSDADFTSFDADGFTLSWTTRSDATARQIVYWAIGNSPLPPSVVSGPTVSSTVSGSFVDTPFSITARFNDNGSAITGCDYSLNNGGAWTGATVSGSGATTDCTTATASCSDGTAMTILMRATNIIGTTNTGAVAYSCDALAPATTDNQTSSNWQTTEKAIILTPNDGIGSGVTAATGIYGCFGASCAPAVLGSNTMTTNCGAGNECTYDVRYYSIDDVGNTEAVKTSSYQARIDRKSPTDGTISAVPGNALVSLSWSGFSDAGSGMNATDAYKLVFLTTGFPNAGCTNGADLTAVTTGTSYIHTGLTNGTTYYYRLCAYDAANNISTGVTVSATPTTACVRVNPSVSISPVAQNVIQGASAGYTVSVTNNDNPNCTATTFNLSKTDAPVVPNANFSASTLAATSTGALNPQATWTTTLTHTATAGATINSTEQTYVTSAADGNGHTAVQSNTVTTTVRLTSGDGYLLKRAGKSTEDELCHGCHKTDKNAPSDANSIKTHSSEWLGTCSNSTYKNRTDCIANSGTWTHGEWNASGGWGIAGAKYGKMLCTTCHTGHNTANIYIVKEAITTPDGSNFQGRATNSATVNFRKKTGTPGEAMVNGNMGDDSDNHTTSTRVCEVCHTYNATDTADGVKYHGYNMGTNPSHKNAEDCIGCHSHKVAFQAGESGGGASCEGCHSDLWGQMRTTTTTGYHHALNNANATYATITPQPVNMGGSTDTNRNCLTCHVDHDYFRTDINTNPGSGRGKNLRASISTTPAKATTTTYSNTDFINDATLYGGVCMSCHVTSQTNMGYLPQPDGSTAKLAIPYPDTAANQVAAYNASAHQYNVSSTFSGAGTTTFNANCSKCHNDNFFDPNKSSYNAQGSSTYKFGNHQSTLRRVLAVLGITTPADPEEEDFCYRCHSKTTDTTPGGGPAKGTAGRDYYGISGSIMSTTAEDIYAAMQLGSAGTTGYGTTSSATLYLRNTAAINTVPPIKPTAYQYSSGTYTTNTFTQMDMAPTSGATTASTAINTGTTAARYDRGLQFVSPQIDNTVTIPSGSTFTLTIRESRGTGTSTDYTRFTVYKWNGTTATPFNTSAAPNNFAQNATAITTTATNRSTTFTSNQAVTLNPGESIICDVEYYHSAGTTNIAVTYAYGLFTTDAAALALPAGTYNWRTTAPTPASGRHNVVGYSGLHKPSPTDETLAYISSNKHVECADCHNPHAVSAGTHAQGSTTLANVLKGVSGVTVASWPAEATTATWATYKNTAVTYTFNTSSTAEWQICFKCHSNANTNVVTWGGSGAQAWVDVGLEFNPNNQAYHPVVQALPSTGNRRLAAGALTGGWTPGSVMTCTDCHATDSAGSKGPHGSSVKWMLNPNTTGTKYYNWPYTLASDNGKSTGTLLQSYGTATPDNNFCISCHVFSAGGDAHAQGNKHQATCVSCHIRVPHGGKVPRLLTGANAPARYKPDGNGGGTVGIVGVVRPATGTIGESNCNSTSACNSHGATGYIAW